MLTRSPTPYSFLDFGSNVPLMAFPSPFGGGKDRLWKKEEQLPGMLRLRVLDNPFDDFRKYVRPIVLCLEGDVDECGDAGAQDLGNRRK